MTTHPSYDTTWPEFIDAIKEQGRKDCAETHGALYHEGRRLGMEITRGYVNDAYRRGQRRGALWALGACLGLAVWAVWWRGR